jgi:hypothetical protein
MDNRKLILIAIAAMVALMPSPASASYAIYVGKNLTTDGSVFIGGTGDEPSSHWLEIVPRKNHAAGETISVGVTKEANYPGELIEIPQVPVTAKYITMNYSEFVGFPAPLTNGGLNEYGVAARDVWSPSRQELAKMTLNPQHGPKPGARLWLLRVRRAAIVLIGDVVRGSTTPSVGYRTGYVGKH